MLEKGYTNFIFAKNELVYPCSKVPNPNLRDWPNPRFSVSLLKNSVSLLKNSVPLLKNAIFEQGYTIFEKEYTKPRNLAKLAMGRLFEQGYTIFEQGYTIFEQGYTSYFGSGTLPLNHI